MTGIATIPMLCAGALCLVPVVREIPQGMDPDFDCAQAFQLIKPVLVPTGDWKLYCVLVEEPCSSRGRNKCKKPGDEWIR